MCSKDSVDSPLRAADLQALKKKIFATLGADADILGALSFDTAVSRRMSAVAIPTVSEYRAYFESTPKETQYLIDETIVPETWFFRETDCFPTIVQELRSRMASPAPVNILSIPCATGEEVYSIAALARSEGYMQGRVSVVGIDIGAKCIDWARAAQYRDHSFRAPLYPGTEGFFSKREGVWHIDQRVTACTNFIHINAFEFLANEQRTFSIILCRNLLIYFSLEKQIELLNLMINRLDINGLLILSAAESPLLSHPSCAGLEKLSCTCYKKSLSLSSSDSRTGASEAPTSAPLSLFTPVATPTKMRRISAARTNSQPDPSLKKQQCTVATTLSEELSETGVLSSQEYFSAALVAIQLSDASAAEAALRRVLYLEPAHEEALLHLALLKEEEGHTREAQLLRARALRAHERSEGRE